MNRSMEAGRIDIDAMPKLPQISVYTSVTCCFALSCIYVGSLYLWSNKSNRDRNHPETIKRRFCSASMVMCVAPVFVYKFSAPELLERVSFLELLGLRWQGLLPAIALPYLLTVLLFLGPLCLELQNESLKMFLDWRFWLNNFKDLIWLRNHIVAPLTEEFVYRSCMMPLILQSFSPLTSVFITPLFFGTAHVHHIIEHLRQGLELKTAIVIALAQFTFTTLFGFYSAYLFARTGHFVAPLLVHSFCNHMGLPDFNEVLQQAPMRRALLIAVYILGLVSWVLLLRVATLPSIYSNNLFWNVD